MVDKITKGDEWSKNNKFTKNIVKELNYFFNNFSISSEIEAGFFKEEYL